MTKGIFKICLGSGLRFSQTLGEWGRDEKIRRMCSSPNQDAETNTEQFYHKLHRVIRVGMVPPRGPGSRILQCPNALTQHRFPPDSQQILDRLTPPEQWDERGDGFLCVSSRQHPTAVLSSGCCVCSRARKLSQHSPEGDKHSKTAVSPRDLQVWCCLIIFWLFKSSAEKGRGKNMDFHIPYSNINQPLWPISNLSYLQTSVWRDFKINHKVILAEVVTHWSLAGL